MEGNKKDININDDQQMQVIIEKKKSQLRKKTKKKEMAPLTVEEALEKSMKKDKTKPLYIFSLFFWTILVICCNGYLASIDVSIILRDSFMMTIMTIVFVLILLNRKCELYECIKVKAFFQIPFVLSCIHILVGMQMEVFHAWMVGPLIMVVLLDVRIGVWSHLVLTTLYCLVRGCTIPQFVFYFALGALICLTVSGMRKLSEFFQTLGISVLIDIVLLLAYNQFALEAFLTIETLFSVLSVGYIVILAYIVGYMLNGKDEKEEIEEEVYLTPEEIVESDFPILQEFQAFSKHLFIHSVDVSELSYMAAIEIGANANVAKAIGMYHEIGRMKGKDYIKEGMKLAKANHFPEEVVVGIKEHNVKYGKPTTVESVIVMLSDSIVSTIEYLESVNKMGDLSAEQVVDNVLKNRFQKKALDASGLTIGDYHKLWEFYCKNAF